MSSFDDPAPSASVCGVGFALPSLSLGFVLPPIPTLPTIVLPVPTFALSCSPGSPVDVTGDTPPGGGRAENQDPDPDQETE